jgi:cation:H+ antiporter
MLALLAIVLGLLLLIWSADRFVVGSASTARYYGMPPLLVGMVIVGMGTSAPEMTVSILAAYQGNTGIALGNAYGSNITNIALILGLTALISPILVNSKVVRKELPILLLVTLLAAYQLWDGEVSRVDAIILLLVFVLLMGWTIRQGMRNHSDQFGQEVEAELDEREMPLRQAIIWTLVGLLMLIISSRLLVWGAVETAQSLGVSDMIIGLTIVAVGTSLPELASSVIAARKGEHDIALGNIIGSNLFNTLAVVGLAGIIHPMAIEPEVFSRDILVMIGLTLLIFVMAYGYRSRGPSHIGRIKGTLLILSYVGYTSYLIATQF